MLSFERILPKFRPFIALCAIGLLGLLAACTVQPLYKTSGDGTTGQLNVAPSIRQKMAGIVIDAPSDRYNQMVRNRLIFLLQGGKNDTSNSLYQLSLNSGYSVRAAVQVDIGDTTDKTGRASAGSVAGTANYLLKDASNKLIAKRTRSVSASFDRPRQEYANLQAEEDAKKRSAEELAEQIFLSIAQDLSKI